MANSTPRSYQQILGAQLTTLRSKLGLKKFKPGGPLLTLIEAASQSDAKNGADIFTLLQNQDLDNAEGIVLDRLGAQENCPRRQPKPSRGFVTISDSAFSKLESTIYHGRGAPIVGSTTIYVSQGSSFDTASTTGEIYIGRETNNYEGPLTYTNKENYFYYWKLTTSATSKFHNQGESVILAQGGSRPITAGQYVSTSQGSPSAPVSFFTTQYVEILDGETEIEDVPITCSTDGISGNLPANTIVSFGNALPFSTALVTNPKIINFGRNVETDQDYRDRIRQARGNKQKGNVASIKNAIVDLSSESENSSVLSSNLVKYMNKPSVLYIDDGNGYEEKSDGAGYECLIESASGGETEFLTVFSPIAKAYIESQNLAPYSIPDGAELTIEIGGVTSTHYFDINSFSSPTSPSGYDVVSSVNSNYELLFQARTSQNGQAVIFYAKSETNDDLKVVYGSDVNTDTAVILGLSNTSVFTTNLYKNDVLLSKDGSCASLQSTPANTWQQLLTSETLIINVDGTGDFTYTITDADFQALNHSILNNATTEIWAEVLTSKLPGITAVAQNDIVILTSNKGKSSSASIEITGGTLVVKNVFATESVVGQNSDYIIDRAVGTIALTEPLVTGDKLTLGTTWPEAFVEHDFTYPTSFSSNSSYYLSADDTTASIISTSVFRTGLYSTLLNNCAPNFTTYDLGVSPSTITAVDTEIGDWILMNDTSLNSYPEWQKTFRNNAVDKINVSQPSDIATRIAHTATATDKTNHDIFIMGGCTTIQNGIGLPGALKGRGVTGSCVMYTPGTGKWTTMPDMITPRAYHTATLLATGNIFICGGFDVNGNPLSSCEIFNTTSLTFSAATGMTLADGTTPCPRVHHSATLLDNGEVLVTGGCSSTAMATGALTLSSQYVPGTNAWNKYNNMNVGRYGHQTVLIATNTTLTLGGISTIASQVMPISSVEQYVDGLPGWAEIDPMTSGRAFFGCAFVYPRVVVAGNCVRVTEDNTKIANSATGTYQVYDVINGWETEGDINADNPTLTAEFVQSDLVASQTNNRIIAGYVTHSNLPYSRTVKTLRYNTGTDNWDDLYTLDQLTAMYMGNREATPGVAVLNGGDYVAHFGGAIQQILDQRAFRGITSVDIIDAHNTLKTHPFPVFTNLSLAQGRVIACRSEKPPVKVTIPSNSSFLYTASTFASAFSSSVIDAEVHQTTKLRLSTHSLDGALMLVDQDTALPLFLPNKELVVTQRSQYPHIVSNSAVGVPSSFQLWTVGENDNNTSLKLCEYSDDLVNVNSYMGKIPFNGIATGVRSYGFGSMETAIGSNVSGNAKGFNCVISSLENNNILTETETLTYPTLGGTLGLRSEMPVMAGDPIYIGGGAKFEVNDTLNIVVDKDTNAKRFIIPMARKMATNNTYQSPLSLKDADNSNATISTAFGINYDFNDFAIVSRARVLTDSTDSTKRILWRYNRYGEAGNNVSLRYMYPNDASQAVSLIADPVQNLGTDTYYKGLPKVTVNVVLDSGVLRKNRNISPDTRFGITRASTIATEHVWTSYVIVGYQVTQGSRASENGDTTLRISVPFVTNIIIGPNLSEGDVLWYKGVTPGSSTLFDGQFKIKTITEVSDGVWDITIDAYVLNDGTIWAPTSNPGTISTDPNQEAKFDSEVTTGDLIVLKDPSGIIDNRAMRITTIGSSRQHLVCTCVSFDSFSYNEPIYSVLSESTDLKIFAPPTSTATTLAAAVNAITTAPVSAVVTGTGAGTINRASWDINNQADYRYNLSDGINYVKTTNVPANITLPTTFDLKIPVTSTLASNSDFANEIFYLVPQLPTSIVSWLNTPTITGLWSVATIKTSDNGTKVQIQSNTPGKLGSIEVEGGAANSQTTSIIGVAQNSIYNSYIPVTGIVLTVSKGEAQGLVGDSFIELNNTERLPKVTNETAHWGDHNQLLSISTDGVFTFNSAPYDVDFLDSNSGRAIIDIEKIGNYVAVHINKGYNNNLMTLAQPGNWISIQPYNNYVLPCNCGRFKILRFSQTETVYTYWIKNTIAVDETNATAYLINISASSPVIGDSLVVYSNEFGLENRKEWIITEVGNGYTNNTITVSTVDSKTTAFSGSVITTVNNISIIERNPNTSIKKILCISDNPINSEYADILLDENSGTGYWQQASGTILTSLEKLGFDNSIQIGNDAYCYNTGLIAETKKVIYGDEGDIENYPGYVAEGARILIQGPTVKRIKLSLQIRRQSNLSDDDLANDIRSAVSGVINGSPVGTPVAISDIIAVVNNLNGIEAVSVLYPEYTTAKDRIEIRGQEKGMIVSPDEDIQILFAGN
jgi:uncharacterized phage protein gp47/JayE